MMIEVVQRKESRNIAVVDSVRCVQKAGEQEDEGSVVEGSEEDDSRMSEGLQQDDSRLIAG